MSGHSKWSTIKHKKAATDKKRGKLFSKLARAIIVAAREGGPDPNANNALANAIAKAKQYSLPKDNIERAIQRGAGAGEGDAYETVTYEGYGPGGAAFVVDALTDNRNRTAANVRAAFNKGGGSLGQPGSVAWMFDRKGVVVLEGEVDEDELMLAAADAGAEDIAQDGDVWQVTCDPADLGAVRDALEGAGFTLASADLTLIPKTTNEVDADGARRLLKLVDALEDDDDVQDVYFNFEIPDEVMAEQV
jgi:YebC/PmpR family DNA-binding regulatory protein